MANIEAVKRVIASRRSRGATDETILRYLRHLLNGSWEYHPEPIIELIEIELERINSELDDKTTIRAD